MAEEDILLRVGLDTTPAIASLKAYYQEVAALQNKAAAEGVTSKTTVLPPGVQQRLADPRVVQGGNKTLTTEKTVQAAAKTLALEIENQNVLRRKLGLAEISVNSDEAINAVKGARLALEQKLLAAESAGGVGLNVLPKDLAKNFELAAAEALRQLQAQIGASAATRATRPLNAQQAVLDKQLATLGIEGTTTTKGIPSLAVKNAEAAEAAALEARALELEKTAQLEEMAAQKRLEAAQAEEAKRQAALEKEARLNEAAAERRELAAQKEEEKRQASLAKEEKANEKAAVKREVTAQKEEEKRLASLEREAKANEKAAQKRELTAQKNAEKEEAALKREADSLEKAAQRREAQAAKQAEIDKRREIADAKALEARALQLEKEALAREAPALVGATNRLQTGATRVAENSLISGTPIFEQELATQTAELAAFRQRLTLLSSIELATDEDFIGDTAQLAAVRNTIKAATLAVANAEGTLAESAVDLATQRFIQSASVNELKALNDLYLEAQAGDIVAFNQLKAALAERLAAEGVVLESIVGRATSENVLSTAVKDLTAVTPAAVQALVDNTVSTLNLNNVQKESLLAQAGYIDGLLQAAGLTEQQRLAILEADLATGAMADSSEALAVVQAQLRNRLAQALLVNPEAVAAGSEGRVLSRETQAAQTNLSADQELRLASATATLEKARLEQAALTNSILATDAVYLEAVVKATIAKAQLAEVTNLEIAGSADAVTALVAEETSRKILTAQKKLESAATDASIKATYEELLAKQLEKNALLELEVADGRLAAARNRTRDLEIAAGRRAAPRVATGGGGAKPPASGLFGGLSGAAHGEDAGAFFGRGLGTVAKYALPSMLLFGAFAGIKDAVKDSEELSITFTKLQSQFADVNDPQGFEELKKSIFEVSDATGIMAAEVGDVALQLQGAFGDGATGLKGSDDVVRYGAEAVQKQLDAAGKLSVVTGIAQAELVDGLTAASFAFGASADRIGDVAARLETSTGVKAKETISFLGDIGPVAEEAGFSLEEFASIAALAQKRSGQSGSALAEQFGRIIPAIAKNKQELFDLANANSNLFGESFKNAIATGDIKTIFNELAKNFSKLDDASQNFIVNLIGGRREANALLSVFGDENGLKKNIDAANKAAGTLDARFAALQKRFTIILKQIGTEFTKIGKFLLDTGLGKAVGLTLIELRAILKVINGILSPVKALDDLFGGILSNIAGVVIQMKVLSAIWTALLGKQVAGGAAGGVSGMFSNLVANGIFSKSRDVYRNALIAQNKVNLPGIGQNVIASQSNQALRGALSVGQNVQAGAKGLKAALGGSLGIGFLAATAAFSVYSIISDNIEKDRLAMKKFSANLARSKESANELNLRAKKMRDSGKEWKSSWDEFWHTIILDEASRADIIEAEANTRRQRGNYRDTVKINNNAVVDNTKRIRNALRNGLNKQERANLNEFGEEGFGGASWESIVDSGTSLKLILARIGSKRDPKKLNMKVREALASADPVEALRKLTRDTSSDNKAIAAQANELLGNIDSYLRENPKTAALYKAIGNPINKLANASNEYIGQTLDDLKVQVEAGRISYRLYRKALEAKLKDLLRIDPKNRDKEQRAAIRQIRNDLQETYSKLIGDQQSYQTELFDLLNPNVLGGSALLNIQNATNNLNDPKFTNPEDRRAAALSVVENTRKFYEALAANTTDLGLLQQLVTEGIELPPEAKAVINENLIKTSESYKNIATVIQKSRGNKELNKILKSLGIENDKGPGSMLKTFLEDYFSADGLDPEYLKGLQDRYTGLAGALKTKGLSKEDKNQIISQLQLLAQILGFAGALPENVKVPDSVTPGTPGWLFDQQINNDTIKLSEIDAFKRNNDLKSRDSNLLIAALNKNEKAIAEVQLAVATDQLARAEALKDVTDEEKSQAINEAKIEQIKAQQALAQANQNIAQSRIAYQKAVAEANGDFIQSAREDVAAAEQELAFAQSTGDEAGINNARAALVGARRAEIEARQKQRDAQVALLKAVFGKDDPVIQAQFDLNLAKLQYQEAIGVVGKAEAALRVVEAEKALRDAMQAANYSVFNLRQAQLAALDDSVGVADVQRQLAAQQLRDAIANGAGTAEINNLRAALINADKGARDAVFQDKLDEYKYLLDTNKITKFQYIQYLEALKNTLIPGSKQFKDLELTLKGLKDDISSDLQANLPTAIKLPTLYEVRRLNQTPQTPNSPGGVTGYQDTRIINGGVNIQVNGAGLDATAVGQEVAKSLEAAFGTGRNGSYPSRY